MSDVEKPQEEDKESQTDVSPHVQAVSLDKIIQRPEASSITINFYSPSYTLRSDKPVQTDTLGSGLVSKSSFCSRTKGRKLASESREIRSFEYTQSAHKNINNPPHETRQNKFMNTKKISEGKSAARNITDLERKKLEAELKATEEIAKLQQAVIEKRLALELASLQDGNDPNHKNPAQQQQQQQQQLQAAQEEIRKLQDLVKKPTIVENSLTRGPDLADYPNRSYPPRPPQPTKPSVVDTTKLSNSKTDSSFLTKNSTELSPLRQLLEKRINMEMRGSKISDPRPSPPPGNYRDRYPPYDSRSGRMNPNMPPYPPPDEPGCSPYAVKRSRNRSLWKSAVIKIKRKIKPPPPWQ